MQHAGISLSLEGRVALITGGSRGIGAAAVRLFRKAGAKVAFSYRAAEAQALALQDECGGPEWCFAIRQELATAADGDALVKAAVTHFGGLNILVANHGIWPPYDAPISSMTDAQWSGTIGINLDSVFGLIRASVAQMQSQETLDGVRGHVILVSSTAGQRGEAFHADYAATKGALISMTKGLSTELAPQHIRVNCVAPGWVHTEMSESTLTDPIASKKVFSAIPLGRAATPEEIAGPILFLCTPLAGFVAGEIFNVNGGAVLAG
ncbi:SDR family NAD(P)-dependent oxidoreductase [Terriglobus sp. RCC_193]|uniref:SDR family NAD(P)-dependent oxidoreductase n=1 Tax=Terriglobus sp. RCC_193 TaxID=3239218 RepID=UPI003524D23F